MSYETRIIDILRDADKIDQVSETLSYIGWHRPGSSTTSAAVWRIARRSQTGTVWSYEWADGNRNYDNIWDNRASLTYTHLS